MTPKTSKDQLVVLAHRTGDNYYDIDRYMPSNRVREADADWLRWREDVKRAMVGIDSTLEAAEEAIPVVFNARRDNFSDKSPRTGAGAQNPRGAYDPVQALIEAQRDAIDVAKAHLAVAIEGQERAERRAAEDKTSVEAAQRQARISNYFAAGGFLAGIFGLLYGVLF